MHVNESAEAYINGDFVMECWKRKLKFHVFEYC